MSFALPTKAARLAAELRTPLTAAILVTGVVRLLLSVKSACDALQCDDFGRFWYATSEWCQRGTSLYSLTPASVGDEGKVYANLNLPHTHILFLPFSWLDRDVAAAAWFVVGVVCVVLSLAQVHRETGWRPTWGWVTIFVWWMPTHVQAVTGQVAWILLLPVTVAWVAARRGRWLQSGAWLGVAIALKPFLLPMLAWLLWRRNLRAVAAALLAGGTLCAVGGVVFGASAYVEWQQTISIVDWYGRSFNASVWGAVFRTLVPNSHYAIVVDLHDQARLISIALSTALALATWLGCRRHDQVDDQWNLVMAATLLICPLGWIYYGCLLLPGWRAKWPGVLATACWLVPTPWLVVGQPSVLATVLWGSAATWGLSLVWWRAIRVA